MQLKNYLEKYRIHPVEFAVRCGISPASIYFYLKGRKPNQKTAEVIEEQSDGLVTVMELRGKDKRKKNSEENDFTYPALCVLREEDSRES